MTEPLLVDRRSDGVVVLTLAVPERRNAMTPELTAAWARAVAGLRGDRGVRAVVVTGQGSAFSAGGDLGWLGDPGELSVDQLRDRMVPFYRQWLEVCDLEVPTLAAVNGPAIGAGAALALACDLRYAAAGARFSVPFTRLGLHPGMGSTFLLTDAVGPAVARELLLTGRSVDAQEALRLGLVSAVYDDARLLEEVLDVAATVAATAPIATRLTKQAFAAGGPRSLAEALRWEGLAQPVTLATDDVREGIAAARERRPPRFTGT